MSRAALALLPCKYYPPSSRRAILRPPTGTGYPVPAEFIPPPLAAREGGGGGGSDSAEATILATTTGSIVDRILCMTQSSLSLVAAAGGGAAVAGDDDCEETLLQEGCGATIKNNVPAAAAATPVASAAVASPASIALSGTQLEQAVGLLLAGISDAVAAARLRWRDVSHLRVYYVVASDLSSSGRARAPRAVVAREKMPPSACGKPQAPQAPQAGAAAAAAAGVLHSGGEALARVEGYYCSDGARFKGGEREWEELLKRATFLALASCTRERPALTFVPVSGLGPGTMLGVHATAWSLDRLRTELWVRGAA